MGKTNDQEPLDEKINGSPFTWRQALSEGTNQRIQIPTPIQHDNIVRQAHALTSVYYLLGGFTITSWLRSPEHNKAIGGSPNSMHLMGLATDFVPLHHSPDVARAKIRQAGIYPGRTELNAKTWCHYDLKNRVDFYV